MESVESSSARGRVVTSTAHCFLFSCVDWILLVSCRPRSYYGTLAPSRLLTLSTTGFFSLDGWVVVVLLGFLNEIIRRVRGLHAAGQAQTYSVRPGSDCVCAWELLPRENPLLLRVVLSCPPQISHRPPWSDNSLGRVREILLASWINVSTSNFHGWLFHACDLRCILNQAGKLIHLRKQERPQNINKLDLVTG